jgi:hypothetical protein
MARARYFNVYVWCDVFVFSCSEPRSERVTACSPFATLSYDLRVRWRSVGVSKASRLEFESLTMLNRIAETGVTHSETSDEPEGAERRERGDTTHDVLHTAPAPARPDPGDPRTAQPHTHTPHSRERQARRHGAAARRPGGGSHASHAVRQVLTGAQPEQRPQQSAQPRSRDTRPTSRP